MPFIYEKQLLNQLISLIGESIFYLLLLMYFNINNSNISNLVLKSLPKTFRSNVFIYILDLFFVSSLLIYTHTQLSELFNQKDFYLASNFLSEISPVITLIAAIVIGDFIGYCRHRFEHSWLIWPFHLMHHSDDDMSWFTIYRFHPINRITTSIIDISMLKIIGFPLWAIGANLIIRHYYGMFIHSKIDCDYGKLNYIFISPTLHQWHHVKEGQGIFSNYSTIFSVWDIMFKTFYLPGKCQQELGVRNVDSNSFWRQMFYPVVYFYKKFKRIVQKS